MSTTQTITLGGGCFWCLEAAYQRIQGITKVLSGYAGGTVPNPSYEAVCTGRTGHAEVVQVTFDPAIITLDEVLQIFWAIHDPTMPDRQGHDVGSEYRSIILYSNEEQRQVAEASKLKVQELWPDPLVTQVVSLEHFYPAEAYHQNYFNTHPEAAYCQIVINPKLEVLKKEFAARLRA